MMKTLQQVQELLLLVVRQLKKAVKPSIDEISINPRSRSAKLRIAKRTNIKPGQSLDLEELNVPIVGGY